MNALTLKNLLREIKRTFTKFLSIFAICALGVAFFAGIRATSPDMKEAGDRLYNTYNLSDISVISTSGLTADNIRDLESIEGIQAVRASLFVDAMARGTGEKEKEPSPLFNADKAEKRICPADRPYTRLRHRYFAGIRDERR